MARVIVVGRGVIGLSCGVALARRGHRVTVVSRPADSGEVTTSEVSAAFWFPYLTAVDPAAGFTEEDLAGPTLERLTALAAEPRSAVRVVPGVEYVGPPAGLGGLAPRWWHTRPEVRLRPLDPAELPDIPALGPLLCGCRFRVPVAHMPGYMAYLAEEFTATGGAEARAEVGSLDDLKDTDVIINCAGLDARQLAHDSSVQAVRGQVLLVRDVPYGHDTLYFLDQGAAFEREPVYIVPRGPDVVLGGTADRVGPELASLRAAAALRPSDEVTARIIRRCALLRPEFASTRKFTAKVGLRPVRPRVRIEWDGAGFRRPVVHCYGHGGGGVTLSWGSALRVADLVDRNY